MIIGNIATDYSLIKLTYLLINDCSVVKRRQSSLCVVCVFRPVVPVTVIDEKLCSDYFQTRPGLEFSGDVTHSLRTPPG